MEADDSVFRPLRDGVNTKFISCLVSTYHMISLVTWEMAHNLCSRDRLDSRHPGWRGVWSIVGGIWVRERCWGWYAGSAWSICLGFCGGQWKRHNGSQAKTKAGGRTQPDGLGGSGGCWVGLWPGSHRSGARTAGVRGCQGIKIMLCAGHQTW